MKILHLVQKPQLRGAEIFASQLALEMNRLGHEAIVVYLFHGNQQLFPNNKAYSLDGNPSRRLYDVAAWRRLARIIRDEKPDIIQANAGDTLKYAVSSKLLFGWRQPVIFRNASTISLYIKSKRLKMWNGFFFHFAKKVISVSKCSARDFARLFPAYKEKIVTIPTGIEDQQNVLSAVLGKNHSSHNKSPVLLHVGGFSFEKNHVGLISIFERILNKEPAARLQLVGDGKLRERIENLVRQKGLSSNIKFLGLQSEPLKFIKAADVLLLPSLIEGLPAVILEGFYCRTPVVAYDVGGISEILIDGQTGRLVEKNNENAFVEAVVDALHNTQENERLVENAYQMVKSKYLNKQIALDFINIYHSLVS